VTAPVRIQRKRTKGWKMPPNTVSVTRPGKWGNPFNLKSSEHCWTAIAHGFKANPAGRHAASVKLFRDWIEAGKMMVVRDCGLYIGPTPKRPPLSPSRRPSPPTSRRPSMKSGVR
jgi:hypothetical protein